MRIESYNVGMLGTNCYLVWDEEGREAMLIDPGAYEQGISDRIEEAGLRLRYIALTHGHPDHIGGATEFQKAFPEARLACPKGDLDLVGDTDVNESKYFFRKKAVLAPDILLGDGDAIQLGGLSFRAIGTPGHTHGGLCYYVGDCDNNYVNQNFSGTLFSGDTIFNLSVGRTDMYGGDFDTLRASIRDRLFALDDDTLVLPGHMGPTTIGREKKHNPFVG